MPDLENLRLHRVGGGARNPIERLSALDSLITGKITGNFRKKRVFQREALQNLVIVQRVSIKFPVVSNREFCFPEQGISFSNWDFVIAAIQAIERELAATPTAASGANADVTERSNRDLAKALLLILNDA